MFGSFIVVWSLAVSSLLVAAAVPAVAQSTAAAHESSSAAAALQSWASATSAANFADKVLAAAPLLSGASAWHGTPPSSLAGPQDEAPGSADLHRIYQVRPGAVAQLPHYVTDRLRAATLSGSGNGSGVDFFDFALRTSGANEYLAELEYSITTVAGTPCDASAGSCLLRVDSLTVWEPSRPAAEVVPRLDVATVTGYRSTGIVVSSSGPVQVSVGHLASERLANTLDALPLGPNALCMEDSLMYEVQFRPAASDSPGFLVKGYACAATVLVSVAGKQLHPLFDRGCSMLHLVQSLLPKTATGTRGATAGCATPAG